MNFAEFLKARPETDDAAGDFVADAKGDSGVPDVTSWDHLETYLVTQSAIPEAIAAAQVVWAEYASTPTRKV